MNKIKFLVVLGLLSSLFIATSCDNEPLDPALLDLINNPPVDPIPVNNGTFTATVDGEANFSAAQIIATYDDSSFGPELNIIGVMANGKRINFQIVNPTVETRSANMNDSNLLFFQYMASSNDSYSSVNDITNESTGTITITYFNTTTNKISGTFSFTGYGALDSSVQKQITNGVFNNITFDNSIVTNPSFAGSYLLTNFNTSIPTDLNGDGVNSTNQLNETSCFDGSLLTLNSNNTFVANSKGVEINIDGTQIDCFEDPNITGTWSVSGNQLTLTYTDSGNPYTDVYTISGNTLTYSIQNGSVVGTSGGDPVTLICDIAMVYTKQ